MKEFEMKTVENESESMKRCTNGIKQSVTFHIARENLELFYVCSSILLLHHNSMLSFSE